MLSSSSASEQSALLPCHPTPTFAGDISAPKLTFRFGAAATATKKLNDAAQGGTPASKQNLLRDCCALSLLSLIPPDRVGCIRKLRLGHTLKKKESGNWMIDLSKQRDGHKTSRFYGPFAASLPAQLTPILD
jgi:hypothetical protein